MSPVVGEATERFRGYLRNKRLRLTPERIELLRMVISQSGHFDADEVAARFRRGRRRVSRATVYRTLLLLEECGIVRKALLGHPRSLYENAIGRGHHDHLICTTCGRIEEFYVDELERLQDEIAARFGYRIHDHVHELLGTCAGCRSAARVSDAPQAHHAGAGVEAE